MNELKVADYQSAPVTVDESTSVYNGIVTMFVEDVGTLFVVNDQQELERSTALRRILTPSRAGWRPLVEVEIT